MIKASGILADVADLVGASEGDDGDEVAAVVALLRKDKHKFLAALDEVHWDAAHQSYSDVGDHSDDGRIDLRIVVRCRDGQGLMCVADTGDGERSLILWC